MNQSGDELPESVRLRVIGDLMKKKRKLMVVMKKSRKVLAKTRAEKKRVIEEIKKLRKTADRINALPPDQASQEVAREIAKTRPRDIYPDDLEREFDKIDRIHDRAATDENQVMDANMGDDKPSKKHRSSKPAAAHGIIVGDDGDGVVDLGEDDENQHADLAGVGIGPDFGFSDSEKDVDEANLHD